MRSIVTACVFLLGLLSSNALWAQQDDALNGLETIDCTPICGTKFCCVASAEVMVKTCDFSVDNSAILQNVIDEYSTEGVIQICESDPENLSHRLNGVDVRAVLSPMVVMSAFTVSPDRINCKFCCIDKGCGICCTF